MTQRRMARPSLGGLMATRQGALLLALLCAGVAAVVLMFALSSYRTSVHQVTPQATVLVATAAISKGTSGTSVAGRGLYKSTPITATQLAPGAMSDASELAGKIATTDILPGQQLTESDFSGPTGVTGLLTPNQRAISFAISEAPGNNDVLQAGDRVDVYAQLGKVLMLLGQDVPVIKPAGASGAGGAAAHATSGQAAGTPTATALQGASLVLAVTDKQAADFVYAGQNGQLYLTLRPDNSTRTPNPLVTAASVIRDSVATVNGK